MEFFFGKCGEIHWKQPVIGFNQWIIDYCSQEMLKFMSTYLNEMVQTMKCDGEKKRWDILAKTFSNKTPCPLNILLKFHCPMPFNSRDIELQKCNLLFGHPQYKSLVRYSWFSIVLLVDTFKAIQAFVTRATLSMSTFFRISLTQRHSSIQSQLTLTQAMGVHWIPRAFSSNLF